MSLPDDQVRLGEHIDALLANPATAASAAEPAMQAMRWCREHRASDDPALALALVQLARADTYVGTTVEIDGLTGWQFVGYFHEALSIYRGAFGPNSEAVAATLGTLVACLQIRNDIAATVEPLRERAAVLKELRGSVHPDVAIAQQQLADALRIIGDAEQAEHHYRRAFELWADLPPQPAAMPTWAGRAALCAGRGDREQARQAHAQAAALGRTQPGVADLAAAEHLTVLARMASEDGNTDDAVARYNEALSIRRAVLGDADATVAGTWTELSYATLSNRPDLSLIASRGALQAYGEWLAAGASAALRHNDAIGWVRVLTGCADHHLALLLIQPEHPVLTAEAIAVVAWRSRLADLLLRPWLASPARHHLEQELRQVRAQLTTREQERTSVPDAEKDIIGRSGTAWIGHVQAKGQWLKREAEIEAQLRQHTAPSADAQPFPSAQPAATYDVLSADECVVQIVRIPQLGYRAFIISAGSEDVTTLDLGATGPIDTAAFKARTALEDPKRAVLHGGRDAVSELARLVVEPLRPALDGRRRVTFALDGPLLHVPIGCLPYGSEDDPLLTALEVRYTERLDELVAGRRGAPAPATGPDVVVAAPNFDLGTPTTGTRVNLFAPLDSTVREADLFPGAVRLIGAQALKPYLRVARSPRMLHLATHGYAFSELTDQQTATWERTFRPQPSLLSLRFKNLLEHPELLSGLALAGANTWLEGGIPGAAAETGLLTVADIAGMDLAGTELVVLSACDTGIGTVGQPEGHASLRAAFLRAGARTVVASLWKVPSTSTRQLMTRFYRNLADGQGKAEALQGAQLAQRTRRPEPRSWGAFVCYGDGGPMSSAWIDAHRSGGARAM